MVNRRLEDAVLICTQGKKWWLDPDKRSAVERARRVLKVIQDFQWHYQRHTFAVHLVSEFASVCDLCIDDHSGLSYTDDSDVLLVCQAWDAIWNDKDSWNLK